MQVSSATSTNYSPIDTSNKINKLQDLSQNQRDTLRETTALKAGKESKEAQLEAYIAGSQQYEASSVEDSSNQDYSQNYTNFSADIRQVKNLNILVQNGIDFSNIPERASIQPITDDKKLSNDQKDSLREGLVSVAGYQSTKDQIEAYKAGAQQSNTNFDETTKYVQNYNEFAADLRRSESLNTYIEYNNYLVG